MSKPEQIISQSIGEGFWKHSRHLSENSRLLAASNILSGLIATQIAPGHCSSETIKGLCDHAVRALVQLEANLKPQQVAANS